MMANQTSHRDKRPRVSIDYGAGPVEVAHSSMQDASVAPAQAIAASSSNATSALATTPSSSALNTPSDTKPLALANSVLQSTMESLSSLSAVASAAAATMTANLLATPTSHEEDEMEAAKFLDALPVETLDNLFDKNFVKQLDQALDMANATDRDPGPPTLRSKLYPHQEIGLAWMVKREGVKPRGGILADDMGLGKTVQIIALTLRNQYLVEPDGTHERMRNLIVAPSSLLYQWKSEILKHSTGGLRIEVHRGTDRSTDPNWLANQDYVITSYHTLVSEMGQWGADRVMLKKPGPLFRVKWWRIILDEASNIKSRTTECSRAVKMLRSNNRWCLSGTPIQNSLDDILSLFEFLRYKPYNKIKIFHDTFTKSRSAEGKKQCGQRLQVALQAVCLRRTKKSTIDGNPILQLPGRTIHMASLVLTPEERQFYQALESATQLRFSRYLKAGTVVSNYSNCLQMLLQLRQACNHPLLIKNIMQQYDYEEEIVVEDDDDAELPPGNTWASADVKPANGSAAAATPVDVKRLLKPDIVRELAKRGLPTNGLKAECLRRLLDDIEKTGVPVTTSALRLPKLVQARLDAGEMNADCVICLDVFVRTDAAVTPCAHAFCRQCIEQHINMSPYGAICPMCRTPLRVQDLLPGTDVFPTEPEIAPLAAADDAAEDDDDVDLNISKEMFEKMSVKDKLMYLEQKMRRGVTKVLRLPSSTKISRLIAVLSVCREEEMYTKSLVFSQFTSMLDLVEPMLNDHGFKFVRYDGTLTQEQRQKVLQQFDDDPDVTVMLCSLKSCSFGLNLTAASRVYMIDPWWNPAVEDQAIDRVYRIGQTSDVKVERFFIKGTVEERILALQEKKRKLAASAFGEDAGDGSGAARVRLDENDLMSLFNVDRRGNALQ
eukprot:m.532596 g.532596  ORF g.532596 m.532596 type:complete len:891 (-) comp22047_c0_seq4:345-3017(-)